LNRNAFASASVISWMKSVQRGKIAALDALEEIALVRLAILSDQGPPPPPSREVLDALLGPEMKFHPDALVWRH